jgi:hypothetical protein
LFSNHVLPSEEYQNNANTHKIKKGTYYSPKRNKQYMFITEDEKTLIRQRNIEDLINTLFYHTVISFPDTNTMIDFALKIKKSQLDFITLEPKIIKYIKNGETVFAALRKAIERTSFHFFKLQRNEEVRQRMDMFTKYVYRLGLNDDKQNKVINAYAVCIDSFNKPSSRAFMQPKVCNPIDKYEHPRSIHTKILVNENSYLFSNIEVRAYSALIDRAQVVAEKQQLSIFEKIKMAKCIAEQALKFIEPTHHPFIAIKKTYEMGKKSAEDAYFMKTGVCGNFSAIAYNIARSLSDITNNIFLTGTTLIHSTVNPIAIL